MLFDVSRPATRIAPGVAHVPGWVDVAKQRALVEETREVARRYAGTPMAMYQPQLKSGKMGVHQLHLGRYWHYETYRYVDNIEGTRVPPMLVSLQEIARPALRAAAEVSPELEPWVETFYPEMALVNYYPPGSGMGMHVDDFEESLAPVISLSIGDEALFRMGNTENRNKPWDDVTLSSGDLIVFGGPKRLAYHGVVRVNDATLPEGCGLKEGRINITIRQIDARATL
ncbi:DNA repair protein [Corynebacterium striatum]|uniref:alpha-ketoglutarate-dependent dioxygenase AlkB n=1 Tax=Corynebacterium striatum TaxID=43770 RepID=UPI000C1CC473|nr:alpha-ketoglutarate-dependent dioxygenase AlkB [Corynebacterium striatum]MBD0855158.1 alpha-ketoglutarate-dependent dioxygenase AlkB [Corynebacterium striatum]PIS64561.1 DNA repair protein [Corynebacterium striatum]PIS65252.1 DNA repair protein [Corynebacterium striatum]PIS66031.1 DNA repair protein [Corynebacterium striatum]PXY05424.1 alpha-ketoglutarate-dependent dioxygenase AlkB [Corynebacterium striatum]